MTCSKLCFAFYIVALTLSVKPGLPAAATTEGFSTRYSEFFTLLFPKLFYIF